MRTSRHCDLRRDDEAARGGFHQHPEPSSRNPSFASRARRAPHPPARSWTMASRLIANLIVTGGQVLLRAAAAAYQKALVSASPRTMPPSSPTPWIPLAPRPSPRPPLPGLTPTLRPALFTFTDAQRSGVAQEAAKGGAASMFARKTMPLEEARMILGVEANASLEDVAARYAKMFEANEKNGSFYLQSKIHRARERIEAEFKGEGGDDTEGGDEGGSGEGAAREGASSANPNAGRGFAASGVDAEEKR